MTRKPDMSKFDFISDEKLRSSFEADFAEVESCLTAQAWKAVHVLIGSIIETILTDYLVSTDYKARTKIDPLTLDLGQLINACEKERVLTQKTKELSSVVKSYRNLIHPGRLIRLREKCDKNSAAVAKALLEMVIEEIVTRKREKYGYTAEQIVAKVGRDASALAILPHLLKDTNKFERARLLLRVIPDRYFELDDPLESSHYIAEHQARLSKCFRSAFDMASTGTKKKVTENFLSILKEEDQYKVFTYETEFFRATDLQYLSPTQASLVKEHLLSRLGEEPAVPLFTAMQGLTRFLGTSDVLRLVDPIVRVVGYGKNEELQAASRSFLVNTYSEINNHDLDEAFLRRLGDWIRHLEEKGLVDAALRVRVLKEECEIRF